MKVLIIYSTTEGQTRKIARYMAKVLDENGHETTISDVTDEPPNPENFDFIFIGASIHLGRYKKPVKYYIQEHLETLNAKNSAFFSVCLAIASDLQEEHEEAEQTLSHFLRGLNWKPKHTFHVAGALKYTEYNWLVKLIMKNIAKKEGESTDTSHDHEYTDWDKLKEDTLRCLSH